MDPALMTAFSLAACGDTRAAELAIARRAQQLLSGMPTPVLHDLYFLLEDARMGGDAEGVVRLGRLLMAQAELQRKQDAFLNEAVTDAAASGAAGAAVPKAASSTQATSSNSGREGSPGGVVSTVPGGRTLDELVSALKAQVEAKGNSLKPPLNANGRLCVSYRAAKKLVLWGVVTRVAAGGEGGAGAGAALSQSSDVTLGSVRAAGWAGGRAPSIPRSLH